jgi:predicted nuclease of predicted toxin-antitoxin system
MRLLFDANLSRSLCDLLADQFPSCEHVANAALEVSSDLEVWNYAKSKGLTIVTKDSDFHQLSFLFGPPPKVIWLRLGNCTTADIEQALRRKARVAAELESDNDASVLIIGRD